ncbi:arginase family protein [Streptomyces sp. NPDC058375]|uniref:arginase family protein n=1 Tax=Streptomyces sp. NPDC058375 TaxID=3346467 RepID=UPI00365A9A8D
MLGLRPSGVQGLPAALLDAGLSARPGVVRAGRIGPPVYDATRDSDTGIAIMPAVDYRLPGGLTWSELETVLRTALADERAVGLDVTIFNPRRDPGGSIAARLTKCLRRGLSARPDHGG